MTLFSQPAGYNVGQFPRTEERLNRPSKKKFTTASRTIQALLVGPLLLLGGAVSGLPVNTPVSPGASPEAQAVLTFFSDIYGKKIIAGQHDGWRVTNGLSAELNYITNTTGKLPALLEMDLGVLTPLR